MGIGRVAWDEISRTGTGQVRSGCPRAGWRDWAKTRVTRGPERPRELPPPHSLHLLPAESCRQRKQPVTSLRGPALGSLSQQTHQDQGQELPLLLVLRTSGWFLLVKWESYGFWFCET